MKISSSIWLKIGLLALIILSILGFFEQQAFVIVKEVAKKNSEFLLTVSEVKMIVSGISSVELPFVSGNTADLENSLNKVQNYLLITDVLSFFQVLLISITTSWVFKVFLGVLFILGLIKNDNKLFTKLLIVSLALSPGLSIFTVSMNKVAQTASIDYGNSYLKELKQTVQLVKEENVRLNQQHEKTLTEIDNGNQKAKFLRKFKEDVSYDLKKAEHKIHGDFKEIRLFIKSSGHQMLVKVSRFCTMIVFSLLIMPLGYSLLVYILYNSLFSNTVLAHKVGLQYNKVKEELENDVNEK